MLTSLKYFIPSLCAVICVSTGVPGAQAADWPQFRGARQDGISTETGLNNNWTATPPPVLWSCEMAGPGFGGPCVADGKLVFVDHQGQEDVVRALDAETGREIWRFNYPGAPKDRFGYTGSTPAVDHGKVYVISRMGLVHALTADSGKLIWKRDLIAEFNGKRAEWDMNISPVVDGDRLIVMPGGPDTSVVTLNKQTGELIWQGKGGEPGYATPLITELDGRKEYVTFAAEGLTGWNPADGQRLWNVPWNTPYKQNAATPLVIGDRFFISSGHGVGCAMVEVKSGTPKILWSNKTFQARFNSPVFWKGFIYGVGEPGSLMCLNADTGELQWKKEGFEYGPVIILDGMLIAVEGKSGDAILVDTDSHEYRESGRIKPLPGPVWTAPIVANGRLFMKNKKTLVCVDLRAIATGVQQSGKSATQPGGMIPVYVGTYTGGTTKGIYRCLFDGNTGSLSEPVLAAETVNPTFLAVDAGGRFLYAVNETGKGTVSAFGIAAGGLKLINQQSTGGGGPCHLQLDWTGKLLFVANYNTGSFAALSVLPDGSLGEQVAFFQFAGSGADPARQKTPHAHSANVSPDNRFVYVADLGTDRIMIYRLDVEKKSVIPNDPPFVKVKPGAGPRHLAFHPGGKFAYVINELDSTITAFARDPATGGLKEMQTVRTVPGDFKGMNSCAEICVHAGGKFLYGSNRGHDSIAIFRIDPVTGALTSAGFQSVGVKTPRNFSLDPSGRFCLVANQGGNSVVVFKIDPGTGALEALTQKIAVGNPVCLRFAPATSCGD